MRWEDLRKPLFSALAAHLILSNVTESIPLASDVAAQASYWRRYYNSAGSEARFIADVMALEEGIRSSKVLISGKCNVMGFLMFDGSRITDALVAANDHLTFQGKKMSEAIGDMDAYIQLTDEVFQQILHSTDTHEKMETVCFYCWFSICLPVQYTSSPYSL